MEQEKPFKTIEVLDARTGQKCKVACMSCIRGHRTTSCGIPICRPKIFWTVKRPGRPSNSCTCRYGATGGCKCVVAKSTCQHKVKKGEKRSSECRCDEQGRYCCLLEPHHWDQLERRENPKVVFYQNTDQLSQARQAGFSDGSIASTPAYSMVGSPPVSSMPSTPAPLQHVPIVPNFNNIPTTPTTQLPTRFGMMGIGASTGQHNDQATDVLTWQGQAPTAPREYGIPSILYQEQQQEPQGCCQRGPEPPSQSAISPPPHMARATMEQHNLHDIGLGPNFAVPPATVSMTDFPAPQPAFDFGRFQNQFLNYQFPSAICQSCGLNGCCCRNCPPTFQNFYSSSWSQHCGRKHARERQPSPAFQKVPRTEDYSTSQSMHSQTAPPSQVYAADAFDHSEIFSSVDGNAFIPDFHDFDLEIPPPGLPSEFDSYNLPSNLVENGLHSDFPEADFDEFLKSEVSIFMQHRPVEDGDEGGGATDDTQDVRGDGGGGCCCSRS